MSNKEDKFSKKSRIILWGLTIIGFLSLLFLVIVLINHYSIAFKRNSEIDIEMTDAVGSLLGGVLAPIVSIISVVFYYHALKLQRRDIELQREALENQTQELKNQKEEMEKSNLSFMVQSKHTEYLQWKSEFETLIKSFKDKLNNNFFILKLRQGSSLSNTKRLFVEGYYQSSVLMWLNFETNLNRRISSDFVLSDFQNAFEIDGNSDYLEKDYMLLDTTAVYKDLIAFAPKTYESNHKKFKTICYYFIMILEHLVKYPGSDDGNSIYEIEVAILLSQRLFINMHNEINLLEKYPDLYERLYDYIGEYSMVGIDMVLID